LSNSIRSLHSAAAKRVAEGIKGAREAVRPEVSQRDLAARLKWPHSVIGMIESRQRHVRVVELIEIAKALDVSPEEVFRRCLR
jgi:ribosome-binding protein aMBF1 (putative translation factor)